MLSHLQKLPDINIICEKLAIAGVTRFEDRFRLPLGISVNFTSFAANLLVLTAYDPEYGIRLATGFGRTVDTIVIDSSALCGEGMRPHLVVVLHFVACSAHVNSDKTSVRLGLKH